MSIEEMMSGTRHVSATTFSSTKDVSSSVFDLSTIVSRILLMQTTLTKLASPDEHLIGRRNFPPVNTFQNLSRHLDVTPLSLNERWCISNPNTALTLNKTMQRFLHSAILPLSQRYQTGQVFTQKNLTGDWSIDTMDSQCKLLGGFLYAQVLLINIIFCASTQ